jgi:hypothetical protein
MEFLPYTNVKFGMNTVGGTLNDDDWPFMRVEEMILIQVEGLAKSGSPAQAKAMLEDFVRTYRDPAYSADASGRSLEDEIWFQRRVELWGEGFSNNDTRRLNKPLVRFHGGEESNVPEAFRFNMTADDGWWLMRFTSSEMNTNLAIIDNTGGIAYNVPTEMRYTDDSQKLVINIPKGNAMLDGKTAVNMLRYCGYNDGDVSRRTLASGFLRALIKKLATPENFTSALTLFSELAQYVETNFTMTDLTKHLEIIFAYPEMGSVELTYPGVFKMNDGVKYYDPDLETAISMFMKYR